MITDGLLTWKCLRFVDKGGQNSQCHIFGYIWVFVELMDVLMFSAVNEYHLSSGVVYKGNCKPHSRTPRLY